MVPSDADGGLGVHSNIVFGFSIICVIVKYFIPEIFHFLLKYSNAH